MTRKVKLKKHVVKEIQVKIDTSTTNRRSGKAGITDRTGQEKGGHAKYKCPHCKITASDVKSRQIHHDSKHPKNLRCLTKKNWPKMVPWGSPAWLDNGVFCNRR
ncbi:putative transcription factor C2H2 family [Rosa chinensis]|uniref:Putative transcription factor C2H2 family n=1 Tax=Rosa chinensis TaxID=74649 RepID=A0A2P6S7T1_ROSCH|nr:putative transcription factor C2H2 family [Rosa chinensis]